MVTSPLMRKKRVAIIGSGLAGLSAAHFLSKKNNDENDNEEGIEVHIFEKAQSVGMDSASIDVLGADGKVHRVDSPMRAVQGGYYTRLLQLYKDLGITLEKSNFTYSFFELSSRQRRRRQDRQPHHHHQRRASRESSTCYSTQKSGNKCCCISDEKEHSEEPLQMDKKSTFIYNGGNGISLRPVSFPSSETILDFSLSPINLLNIFYHFYDMLQVLVKASFFAGCYIYLALLSFYHVFLTSHTSSTSTHSLNRSTLATFLSSAYLPHSFIIEIIIPLFSCVATCSPEEVMAYPAGEILEYIARTFGTDHYIVKGGVRNVVTGLLRDVPEENIHVGCELVSLRRSQACTNTEEEEEEGRLELKEASGQIRSFDEVIFATQANQARFLLADYYKSLRDSESPLNNAELSMEKERLDALGRFSYTTSIVVNHYDEGNTLPSSRNDRRILNLARWSNADIIESSSRSKLMAETKLDLKKQLPKEYIMATHDLSILHTNCRSPSTGAALLQTTNPTVEIGEESIVSSQVFERAIMTLGSKETLKRFIEYPRSNRIASSTTGKMGREKDEKKGEEKEVDKCFQGLGGIWFVGSWAAEGIPLLEGCVVSAERAVEAIR